MPALMTTTPEGHGAGKYRLGDHDPNINSEQVTLAAHATAFPDGTVLAKATGGANSGKYVPYDPEGTNGTNAFGGILFGNAEASASADQRVVVDVRGPMHINPRLLNYAVAVTAPQKATVEAAMSTAGIQPRY